MSNEWVEYDGTVVQVDGQDWVLRVVSYNVIYPYRHVVTNVTLEPTEATKRSDHYCTIKQELGDVWVTDVLSSEPEFQAELMRSLQAA